MRLGVGIVEYCSMHALQDGAVWALLLPAKHVGHGSYMVIIVITTCV